MIFCIRMKNMNVHIRGIYSTALTKLFLDAGFPIIFPSMPIQKRFDIKPISMIKEGQYSKEISIEDRWDKQGISIQFKKPIWKNLVDNKFEDFPLSFSRFPDLIRFQPRFHRNDIYQGIVTYSNKKKGFSFIKLLPGEETTEKNPEYKDFQTDSGYFNKYLPEGKEGIFQVKSEDSGARAANLGSYYTIPGDFIVLNPFDNQVRISRSITEEKEKQRLKVIGEEAQEGTEHGYIIRTAAKYANKEEILQESIYLKNELQKIKQKVNKINGEIGKIYLNSRSLNLVFSSNIKAQLDELRQEITPTVQKHHSLKSNLKEHHKLSNYNLNVIDLLDYTEDLLQNAQGLKPTISKEQTNSQDITPEIKQFLLKEYYTSLDQSNRFSIDHFKLTGKHFQLRPGNIEHIDKTNLGSITLVIRRNFEPGGTYDELDIPIEKGDYALTFLKENQWYYCSEYYSKNEHLKGKYYNINTPLEITHKGVHYVDLEIDVVQNEAKQRFIVDEERLQYTYEKERISENLYHQAQEIAQELLENEN